MTYYLTLVSILFVYACAWFIISLFKKRNDIADVAWGLGFVLLAWVSVLISGAYEPRTLLVSLMVTLWGLRLARHIHARHKGKGEDPRYAKWRGEWKNFYLRSFFQVYILQAALLFLVALPVLTINANSSDLPLGLLELAGFLVWTIGFAFEVVGDRQLAQFIADPSNKGKLLQDGLWKYSRHPNYFGEVTLWWGIWLIALGVPGGILSIIGPLTITFLILRVSGVPLLEQRMAGHPDFPEYKRRTSIFIPLLPKKS